jgi:hypothetical protein
MTLRPDGQESRRGAPAAAFPSSSSAAAGFSVEDPEDELSHCPGCGVPSPYGLMCSLCREQEREFGDFGA